MSYQLKEKTKRTEPVSKAAFRQFSTPKPGPHDQFMTGLGFGLQQTIGGISTYSYAGRKESITPVGRSVLMIKPLWVTLDNDGFMAIERGRESGKVEPFDEARIVQAVLEIRQTRTEWRFPDLPTEYQAEDDDQIFAGGINWDGDSEDCQPDPDIPFDGRPGYYEDGIF